MRPERKTEYSYLIKEREVVGDLPMSVGAIWAALEEWEIAASSWKPKEILRAVLTQPRGKTSSTSSYTPLTKAEITAHGERYYQELRALIDKDRAHTGKLRDEKILLSPEESGTISPADIDPAAEPEKKRRGPKPGTKYGPRKPKA